MAKTEAADTIRRLVELYRGYLQDGVDADLAQIYLRYIAAAEETQAQALGLETKPK